MNLLDRIKTGNWSGLTLDLQLERLEYVQGDEIAGAALVRGDRADHRPGRVFLDLIVESYAGAEGEKGRHRQREVLEKWLLTEARAMPGGASNFPFRRPLPVNIPVTHEHCTCILQARVEVSLSPDATATRKIKILPSPAISVVQETMAWQLGFIGSGVSNSGGRQVFHFVPGPGTPVEYKDIEQIEMLFTNQEKSLLVQMKARVDLLLWLNSDNYFTLELAHRDIFPSGGAVNHKLISEQISCRLRESLVPAARSGSKDICR
ncbi:sporulation protein [Desulfotomaculum copahuensis]|uniref:Sporulation protein n=1 Tax=Desulfotomaculum copahuensis TaxID=1838280 RepID=A0A1B7LEP5_9FIRM|nr:sporulation protein [Desulfotomaculum copahuensis]OAT81770.1 hypothetical protein A6M21_10245 [Desulfotomaculum copahuensis]